MIFSHMPILIVDVLGSFAMIIISMLSLHKARILREKYPTNTVYLYLMWICSGFTLFALSRSFGHIIKQLLILSSNNEIWDIISPYSGTINTVSFMVVGLITLFFKQSWYINRRILNSQKALENTHLKLLHLNQNLEQKVIERTEMLTTSEHKCRRIFEQSLDTILVTNSQWKIIEINPAGLTMTGYRKDELVKDKMDIRMLFNDEKNWERIQAHINTHEFILNEETAFIRPNGESLLVMITCGVDYGAFGYEKTYHFIIKNINDKRMMEKQMAQAEKLAALGELSAGVAHEINNPLGIILGYTQLMLQQKSHDNSTNHDDLKIIEKHVHACRTVVSDLLTFSRKSSVENTRVNINKVVDDVVHFLNNHPNLREVKVNFSRNPGKELSVTGNEQELRQVMINLLINAGHAVGKHGTITIKAFTNIGNQVLVAIKDNGPGIDQDTLTKIFNPFFTTKPVGEGTGLGLSVSYGIITNHGGEITVESTPGKGTLFTIILPRAAFDGEKEL